LTRHLGPWIALAGLLVGTGLYLGLRERSGAPLDARSANPPAGAPPAPPPTAPAERPLADVEREIAAVIETLRSKWRAACWDPIVTKAPAPPASAHDINIAVDAGGEEILRAINDIRDETRVDVATCLRAQPHEPIVVSPPGRPVSTVISIRFP
jgi:hypothetical protein